MSTTFYGVNAPEAVKLWSRRLAHEVRKATYIDRFIGESADSLIQFTTETQKDKGDRVTVGLRMQLTGAGVQGDGTLEGNEEALTTYTDALYKGFTRTTTVVRTGPTSTNDYVTVTVSVTRSGMATPVKKTTIIAAF